MNPFSKKSKPTIPIPKIPRPKCQICFIKSKKNHPYKHLSSCHCNFCSDCLTEWSFSQLTTIHNYSIEMIRCPSMYCTKSYLITDIIPILSQPCKTRVYDALAKKYCQNTSDIKNCPNTKCNNYGYIAEKFCNNPLGCSECDYEWEDRSLYFGITKIIKVLGRFLRQRNEIFSVVHKEILTKKCPNCHTNIAKYYGCPHIRCASCKFDFCWDCNQKWNFHDMLLCDNMFSMRITLFLVILTLFVYKIGIFSMIKLFFTKYGNFLTNYCTANTLTLLALNQTWEIIAGFRKRNRTDGNEMKIHVAIALFFNLFSLYQTHNFWWEIYPRKLLIPNLVIGGLEFLLLLWIKSVLEWIYYVI